MPAYKPNSYLILVIFENALEAVSPALEWFSAGAGGSGAAAVVRVVERYVTA